MCVTTDRVLGPIRACYTGHAVAGDYGNYVVMNSLVRYHTHTIMAYVIAPLFHGVVGELALCLRGEGLPVDSAGVADSLPETARPGERTGDGRRQSICHATGHASPTIVEYMYMYTYNVHLYMNFSSFVKQHTFVVAAMSSTTTPDWNAFFTVALVAAYIILSRT